MYPNLIKILSNFSEFTKLNNFLIFHLKNY